MAAINGRLQTATFTFWGCNGRQGVHVRGLPALHHGFAHDLQVCVGLIVAGASVVPGGLAVLSLWEYGLSGGGHVVLITEEAVVVVVASGKRFGGLCLHTEEGERQKAAVYIGLRSADTAGVSLQGQRRTHTPSQERGRRRPRSSVYKMIHSVVNNWLTSLRLVCWRNKRHFFGLGW